MLRTSGGYSNQDLLEEAVGYDIGHECRQQLITDIQRKCRDYGIEKVLEDNKLDVIVGPADSSFKLLVCGGGMLFSSGFNKLRGGLGGAGVEKDREL